MHLTDRLQTPEPQRSVQSRRRHRASWGRKPVWAVLIASVLLTACGGDPAQDRFDNYRERLARSLKESDVAVQPVDAARRPERRALRVAQADQRIGLLDFLKLHECAVWQVVGERNSALGKVAPASQRVFGDLDFLRLAPDCIDSLEAKGETRLAETLDEALTLKREELPIALWQATFASEEFERLWHVPERLGDYDPGADLPLETALDTLEHWITRWLAGDYRYDASAFESALGVIRNGNAGYWLRAAAITEAQLAAASAVAANRAARRPLCFNQQANQQGRILLNVVQQFFVGDVQVWAAEINRVLYRVMAPHGRLEAALLAVQPAAYRDWVAARDAQLAMIKSGSIEHVAAVEPLLRSCSLLPARE